MIRIALLQLSIAVIVSVGAPEARAEGPVAPKQSKAAAAANGQAVPASDKEGRLSKDFAEAATRVVLVVGLRPNQFSELSREEIEKAQREIEIDWSPTEHVDFQCPDEKSDQLEVRRPFCLRANGRMAMSSTYFESTSSSYSSRLTLAAGALFRKVGIRGSANWAIARRVADVSKEIGYGGAPNPDSLHGMSHVAVGALGGVDIEQGAAGVSHLAGAAVDLRGAIDSSFGSNGLKFKGYGQIGSRIGEAGRHLHYTVDANGAVAIWPVLVGAWLAVKANQFQSYREFFFSAGLPVLAIPKQLGGEDYLLIRANAGAIPVYSVGDGSRPGGPKLSKQEIFFEGSAANLEFLLKKGAFLLEIKAEYDWLRNSEPVNGRNRIDYTRLEFSGSLSWNVKLLLPNDEIKLEFRHIQLTPEDIGIPDFDFKATQVGGSYVVRW